MMFTLLNIENLLSSITRQQVTDRYGEIFNQYNRVFNRRIRQQNEIDDEIETINEKNINIIFDNFLNRQPNQTEELNINQLIELINQAQQIFINREASQDMTNNLRNVVNNSQIARLIVFHVLIINMLVPLIKDCYHNRHPFRQGMFHHNIAQIEHSLQNHSNTDSFMNLLIQTLNDQVQHAQGLPNTLDHIFDQNIKRIHNQFMIFIISSQPLVYTSNFLRNILIFFSSSGRNNFNE